MLPAYADGRTGRRRGVLPVPRVQKILLKSELEEALGVCPNCSHHHRQGAAKHIELTFDPGSFEEADTGLASGDPLGFPEYADKLAMAPLATTPRAVDGCADGPVGPLGM